MRSKMKRIDFSATEITGGFWKEKQDTIRKTTVYAVYDRFKETGRFDAFRCDWKEGMPNKPHIFWDSDVAKWIEGVAYLIAKKPNKRLERIVEQVIDEIEKNQDANGYFNIYFTAVAPEKRFQNRDCHELYCAGHLIEAAVAYYETTGKRRFLDLMCKYVDYIEKRFIIQRDTGFKTPGHEEIELALVRLYLCLGERRHLALAKAFIDMRGNEEEPEFGHGYAYMQSHIPVREQRTAEGHAVRALYLYCAMADVALLTEDAELKAALDAIFENIVCKRMSITGGVGASACGECFTKDYDLPNLITYNESCAALALALFAHRMLMFEADARYADIVERVIYNGFLSSISLDGKAFFYENPLEIIPSLHTRDTHPNPRRSLRLPIMERKAVFDCSCCPPNIVRFIPSIGNLLYTDDGETLYVHQYMQSRSSIKRNGKILTVTQKTRYPYNGRIQITVTGGDTRIAVRVPGWCDSYKGERIKGYAYFDLRDGESVTLDFAMKTKLIEAHPEVIFDCGRYAVTRGPFVYCLEGVDNGENLRDIRIDAHARFRVGRHAALGVPMLTVRAYRREATESTPLYYERKNALTPITATLIPYHAFANRGASAMQVWHLIK